MDPQQPDAFIKERRATHKQQSPPPPGHYLCHQCRTTHRIDATESPKHGGFNQLHCLLCRETPGSCIYNLYKLQRHHVQLAQDRRRLGPSHGISLARFRSCEEFTDRYSLKIEQNLSARIVDDGSSSSGGGDSEGSFLLHGSYVFTGWECLFEPGCTLHDD